MKYVDRRPTGYFNRAMRALRIPLQIDPWMMWVVCWRCWRASDPFMPMFGVFRQKPGTTLRRWGLRVWGIEIGDRGGFFNRTGR